jgi:hypothetical protein
MLCVTLRCRILDLTDLACGSWDTQLGEGGGSSALRGELGDRGSLVKWVWPLCGTGG